MSDNENQPTPPNELELLKSRANMMGISYSNNIGVDALKQKIQDKMDGKSEEPEASRTDNSSPNPLEQGAAQVNGVPVRELSLREYIYAENMRLVRCRITNLDPKKKDLPGEIFTVANEYLGTVRKFIPFGEHTEEGYHLPYCLYELLKTRKFLNITTTRDKRTGAPIVSTRWAPEFAVEVLDPLTGEELSQLAQAQIAAGSVTGNAE